MKKAILFLAICALCITTTIYAQRSYFISFSEQLPDIDGKIDPEFIKNLPAADSFTTSLPYFGRTPQYATTAYLSYSQKGIYVAAICKSDCLRRDGSTRDKIGTGDYFTVAFDTWDDGQNSFEFTVNAFGQKTDARLSSTLDNDNFNAHWIAQTAIQSDGWTAEIFIPFSALRFPKEENGRWGLQIKRFEPSSGEYSAWNRHDPLIHDSVLQYGVLEQLNGLPQKIRLGASIYTEYSRFYYNYEGAFNQFSGKTNSIQSYVDGRIGINSATTVDFSILPDHYFDLSDVGSVSRFFIVSPLRQSLAEEYGIFQKTGTLDHYFDISESLYGPMASGTTVNKPSKLRQKTRFTTRTRNNIGIGISNMVMSKPLYQSITNEILEYHANPVYNNISVEKTLRNNSWVQISNEYYYVGNTTMNNNKTSIGTQLRDKKNQFEIAGNFNLKSQGKFSVADGSFKIGKINSALTYGISHYTIPKAQRAFLYTSTMPFIVSPFIVSQTYAHITKKDFSPSNNHWLNTSRSIRFSYIKNNSQLQNFPYITLGASGIDRRFRHLSANFTFSPVKMDKILDFTDIQLNTEGIYFPIGGDVYFTSDQRKRFRWSSNIGSKWAIGSDQTNVNAAFNSYWVPSKLFSFSLRNSLDLNNNQTKAFPSVANRLLENYDNLNIENSLNVAFTPMPKFSITTYFLNQYISAFNRQLFELKNDGSIVKTDDIFEYNPKNKHVATIGGRIEYLFTTNSMLYLSINGALTNEIARPFFAPPTTAEIPNTIHNSNINLSFIWNIGKY